MDRYSIALKKKPLIKTALQRAHELMNMNHRDLPPIALGYLSHQTSKYGACGEVLLTAYAHYAQAIEGLKTSQELYKIDRDGLNWFKNPISASYQTCLKCGNIELMKGDERECRDCRLPF